MLNYEVYVDDITIGELINIIQQHPDAWFTSDMYGSVIVLWSIENDTN